MNKLFGAKVRLARLEAGATQKEIANKLGKPKTWIVDIERDRTIPSDIKDVRSLARAVGLHVGDLVSVIMRDSCRRLLRSIKIDDKYTVDIVIKYTGHGGFEDSEL